MERRKEIDWQEIKARIARQGGAVIAGWVRDHRYDPFAAGRAGLVTWTDARDGTIMADLRPKED
jgi:hypothetical protein